MSIAILGSGIFTPRTYLNFTCALSLLDGSAFLANPSANISGFAGRKLTITAGANTLVGWGLSAGTAEALDSEIFASPAFDANTGWTFAGGACEISGGKFYIWGDSSYGYLTDANALTVGCVYKTVPVVSRNTATYLSIEFGTNILQSTGITSAARYGTAFGNGYFKYGQAGAGTIDIDSSTLKKVTAPGTDGLLIVDAKGGATRNWTSNDGIGAGPYTLVVSAN
ncbi:MAG: hypothetical protein WAZ60_23935 [Desulfosalsimonadaceae bacterium]